MSTQSSGAPLPTATHPPIEVDWVGGHEFAAGRAGGPRIQIDGDSRAGPSPFAVLHFTIAAPGATAGKTARAVELSVTRHCSVRSSLIAEAPVTWTIELTP
jgi:hypothetical protein